MAGAIQKEADETGKSYLELERQANVEGGGTETAGKRRRTNKADVAANAKLSVKERDREQGRVVDVVLSDMSEPWDQTTGFRKKSLSDPYHRMANTSGIAFKDHASSMVS